MIPLATIRNISIRTLLVLCFFWCEFGNASAERLPIKIFTGADGLGSSYVNDLMRDSRGFLWICTRDGLTRFDGSRFITYQVGDKDGSPGIEQVLESRAGIYWIMTTGGLYRFDPTSHLAATGGDGDDIPKLNAEFIG